MKRPRNIRKNIVRAAVYSRTLVRLKHYRGAGVHSPFVYGIVRNAIMKKTPQGTDRALFDELRGRGFSRRRAAQLQNLYTFRGFTSAVFAEGRGGFYEADAGSKGTGVRIEAEGQAEVRSEVGVGVGMGMGVGMGVGVGVGVRSETTKLPPLDAGTLCFAMPDLSAEDTSALAERAADAGATICFIGPYASRSRHRLARQLVAAHRHTSVDNRGFLLLFFNRRLPKQHFRL